MEQPNSSESALETSLFSKVGRVTDVIEESLIAFFLGAMTLLTLPMWCFDTHSTTTSYGHWN